MTVDDAIKTVARRVIADVVADEVGEMWEMYPELGEYDWRAVQAEASAFVRKMVKVPDGDFDEAYRLLTRRASE